MSFGNECSGKPSQATVLNKPVEFSESFKQLDIAPGVNIATRIKLNLNFCCSVEMSAHLHNFSVNFLLI